MIIPDELLDLLFIAPTSQLDSSLKQRIDSWRGKDGSDIIDDVRAVIGDCIKYDLASGFTLTVLQTYIYCKVCGGNLEDCVGKIVSTPLS